jgi:hypothetical protein
MTKHPHREQGGDDELSRASRYEREMLRLARDNRTLLTVLVNFASKSFRELDRIRVAVERGGTLPPTVVALGMEFSTPKLEKDPKNG